MPTVSQEVARKFQKRINVSLRNYEELLVSLHGKKRQASLESMLSEQFVLNAAVLWEVFLSDIFIAYVAEDSTPYLRNLKQRVVQSNEERFGSEAAKCIRFDHPPIIPHARVAAWLDPKDFNLTARSAEALAKKANAMLAAQFAKKFTLERDSSEFLDYTLALRNFLAHRSDGARRNLLYTIANLGGGNSEFTGPFVDVGAYLKHRTAGGRSRAAFFAERIANISSQLV